MSAADGFAGIVAARALRKFSVTTALETTDTATSGPHAIHVREVVPQAATVDTDAVVHVDIYARVPTGTIFPKGYMTLSGGALPSRSIGAATFEKGAIVAGAYGIGADVFQVGPGMGTWGFAALASTLSWPGLVGTMELAEVLRVANVASTKGDLRTAYREVFRALNRLFAQGHWGVAAVVLRTLCSPPYPATIGVGAVRFSSSVAGHLSNWKDLLAKLGQRIRDDGQDPREVLRGLDNGRNI